MELAVAWTWSGQGGAFASRALFYLHGEVGKPALFSFAAFLGATASAVLRTGVLARWLGWVGLALGLVVGVLAAGSIAGLDIRPPDQVVFLLVAAWLAFGVGWPLPSAARREAVD